jgi:hypothetical protein
MVSDDGVTYSPVKVLSVDSWKIDRKAARQDVTAFEDTNKTYVQDLADVNGSYTGWWDDTEDTLWVAAASSTGCYMYLYPDVTNNPEKYCYGPAWMDASIDVGVSAPVKVTGTFAAAGDWVFAL